MEPFSGRTATATIRGISPAEAGKVLHLHYATQLVSRLGQGDLHFRNYRVGTVWVSRVGADVALQPRIGLSAGCQLQDLSATEEFPEGVAGFAIVALGGQLRWRSQTGPVVGDLSIPKGLQYLRSTNHPHEHAFTICCDAPHHVLTRLEAERGGAPPVFWMDLAGSWALDGSIQPIYQDPWRFEVPTDMWLAFLSESGYEDFDVIEIRRVLKGGGDLRRAVDYLNAARKLVSSDPSKAVGICRLLVEALDRTLKDQENGSIAEYLTASTDGRRGEQYGRIVSAVKQLAALDHHDFGQSSVFRRPEALTLVRLCEALLLMTGDLTPAPQAVAGEGDEAGTPGSLTGGKAGP